MGRQLRKQAARKSRFPVGSLVKHQANKELFFQVLEVLEPVDPTHLPLYACVPVREVCKYLESDLKQVGYGDRSVRRLLE
jgi:hypothetical protein